MNTYEINGKQFSIIELIASKGHGVLPLLDIPMMSDERWKELSKLYPVEREGKTCAE